MCAHIVDIRNDSNQSKYKPAVMEIKPLLQRKGREKKCKGYMWIYRCFIISVKHPKHLSYLKTVM